MPVPKPNCYRPTKFPPIILVAGIVTLPGCAFFQELGGFFSSPEGGEAIAGAATTVATGIGGGPVGLIIGGVTALAALTGGYAAWRKKQKPSS